MLDGLNQCLKALLKQVAWPPPLASDPSSTPRPSKRPRAQMESEDGLETADPMDSSLSEDDGAAIGVQDGLSDWEGFDAAGPVVRTASCFQTVTRADAVLYSAHCYMWRCFRLDG